MLSSIQNRTDENINLQTLAACTGHALVQTKESFIIPLTVENVIDNGIYIFVHTHTHICI